MKTHTSGFKTSIKEFGRQLDSKIIYTIDGVTITLTNANLNGVTPHFSGGILTSVMKQLDVDTNIYIPEGTEINYQFGVKVGSAYEYLDYGNYIVYSIEKQEDTKSYKIVCYDKMLYSMVDYDLSVTYPITIRNYLNTIATEMGLTFKDLSTNFANYDKEITSEKYLDEDGNSLGYTIRDILNELAQVTASTICISEDDELEVRYITNTNDTIDEYYLKDINVNFGEKFGAVNVISLARSGGSDVIYYPSTLPENPIEIRIEDNQIMNENDRSDYLLAIYNKLNGLEYYINDFTSTGICYYDLCDRYSVTVDNTTYSCVMLNDEIDVTQGLEELIYTEKPEETQTDYKSADTTDRRINQAYIIVNKQSQTITALTSQVETLDTRENNNYQTTLAKFQTYDPKISKIDTIETNVTTLQTNTYTKTEVQQIANGTGVDGVKVSAVISTSGTFDENGMTYEKTGAKAKTTINQVGINVKDSSDNSLLFAGYVDDTNTDYPEYVGQTIVGTDNIAVKNYLNIGENTRIQDYETGTGVFYIGGGI